MPTLLAFFGVFSMVFANLHAPNLAYATTSNTVNFQARLQSATGAIVPDGSYNVEFKLYDASNSSGSSENSCSGDAHCLWTETRTSGNKVTVANGYLTVELGSVTAFPGTIDWSQQLWLTMNIGGTGNSPDWDGEMDPKLKLTATPYAFQAGRATKADQLATTSGGNTSTLAIQAPTGGNQTFQIQDQGTSGTFNILTAPSGSDGYIKLQGSSPSAQTGYFNITGTGIAGALQSGSLDTASAAVLSIGTTNATGITLGHGSVQVSVPGTIRVGTASSSNGEVVFNNSSNGNTTSIKSGATSSSYITILPGTIGTAGLCLAVDSVVGTTQTLGYASCSSGGGGGGSGGVTLQASTPGTADAGNINITGTAIAATLQASTFDTASAGTLSIGNANATTLDVATNNAAHTISIGTGAAAQTITIGSSDTTSSLSLVGGTGGIGFSLSGSQVGVFDSSGGLTLTPLTNGSASFKVQNASGVGMFYVSSVDGSVYANGWLNVGNSGSIDVQNGSLILGGTNPTTYTSPRGASLTTKIDIPNYDPGNYNQIIALGLPSGSSDTARAILVADNRATAHQPSIALLSPDEDQIFGLSWDGSSETSYVKTTGTALVLQAGGVDLLSASDIAGTKQVAVNGGLEVGSSNQLQIDSSGNLSTSGTASVTVTSSTAFQIQKASGGGAMFTVDSSGQAITIGPSGGDSTGTLLVLGNKTGDAADPTGTNGAMYYNATSNAFRCYENGVWRSCLGGLVNASTAPSTATANTTTLTNFSGGTNNSYGVLANDCQTGVTYTVTASGVYSTTGAPTLQLYLNEDDTSTHLAATSAITMPSGASNLGWQLTAQMICVDTTHVEVQGSVTIGNATVSLATSAIVALIQNTGTAAWTTSSHTLYVGAQWGTANSSNTITMRQFIVQRMGP